MHASSQWQCCHPDFCTTPSTLLSIVMELNKREHSIVKQPANNISDPPTGQYSISLLNIFERKRLEKENNAENTASRREQELIVLLCSELTELQRQMINMHIANCYIYRDSIKRLVGRPLCSTSTQVSCLYLWHLNYVIWQEYTTHTKSILRHGLQQPMADNGAWQAFTSARVNQLWKEHLPLINKDSQKQCHMWKLLYWLLN